MKIMSKYFFKNCLILQPKVDEKYWKFCDALVTLACCGSIALSNAEQLVFSTPKFLSLPFFSFCYCLCLIFFCICLFPLLYDFSFRSDKLKTY